MWKTYEECRKLILPKLDELKQEKKLQSFCESNKLHYQQLLSIRSTETVSRPALVKRLLDIFGYNVSKIKKETLFDIMQIPETKSISKGVKKAVLKKIAKKKKK